MTPLANFYKECLFSLVYNNFVIFLGELARAPDKKE